MLLLLLAYNFFFFCFFAERVEKKRTGGDVLLFSYIPCTYRSGPIDLYIHIQRRTMTLLAALFESFYLFIFLFRSYFFVDVFFFFA